MNILLSSALLNAEDMLGQYSKGGGAYLPHGLLSIAAILIKNGHTVSICDPYAVNMLEDQFRSYLLKHQFDIIGLGNCYTSQVDNYFATAKICKDTLPHAKICIGGAHPTIFPKETLERCQYVDYVVQGEGEYPFLDLVNALGNRCADLSHVRGLVYSDASSAIRVNQPFPGLEDGDQIPIFPYHLLHMDRYIPPPSNYKTLPTFGMLIQRGCPYNCIYCDSRIHGKKLRQISVDKAIDEIRFLCKHYGMKGVIFHDSIFTINRRWTVEFCTKLIEQNINISWICYTRPDAVDEDLCALMRKAGCWCISFGIETANQESLNLIKKNITLEKVKRGIKAAQKAAIEIVGSIILCLPGENEEMVKNTIRFVKDMDLDIVVFFLPVPFPGTELYEVCKKEGGLVDNIQWKDYKQWMDQKNPLYINPKIGKEKMLELYQYAFRAFYLSPHYIFKNIKRIKSFTDIKKYCRGFSSIKSLLGISIKSPFHSLRD